VDFKSTEQKHYFHICGKKIIGVSPSYEEYHISLYFYLKTSLK